MLRQRRPARTRQPNDQTSLECVLEIRALERIAAFGAGAARSADQTAQCAIARPVGGQRHEFELIDTVELRADDQRQFVLLGSDMGAHHARERAFIGECERPIAQALGLGDQLLGLRSAAQKREIAQGMQFGVHGLGACLTRTRRANTNTGTAVPEKPTAVCRPFGARCSNRVQYLCRPTSPSRCVQDPARESNHSASCASRPSLAGSLSNHTGRGRSCSIMSREVIRPPTRRAESRCSCWTRCQAASGRCSGIEQIP